MIRIPGILRDMDLVIYPDIDNNKLIMRLVRNGRDIRGISLYTADCVEMKLSDAQDFKENYDPEGDKLMLSPGDIDIKFI